MTMASERRGTGSQLGWGLTLGAQPDAEGVRFRVWAPAAARVAAVLYESDGREALFPLAQEKGGYHAGRVSGVRPGARYRYRLDDGPTVPDPASRFQPQGVHGPSEVVAPDRFSWTDGGFPGLVAEGLVLYELHVGTFTPAGTFLGAIERLPDVAALGCTAIELMPIANFPGARNWGYDGVNLFAPATAYGRPEELKELVDAAHQAGLGVVLDVVYNHLGPEGNYLPLITGGRFFTARHKTPWGDAVNYDGPDSGPVRDFVRQNALYWAHEYHLDGLRLDATHAILDDSPVPILREIADDLHALAPRRLVIAEDERNERRLVAPPQGGGYGLDAVWADDLHHELRRATAGDRDGYYAHYAGTVREIVRALERGWYFEGQAPAAGGRPRGTSADALPPSAFIHCLQNHDQVGNRPFGDRLHHAIPLPVYRALTALLLTSPYTPLLWMGQEWAASTPFQYFTDHPPELGRLVTQGRREEFKDFTAFSDPAARARIPDPQAETTFAGSTLRWDERDAPPHRGVLALYRTLLALRRHEPALRRQTRDGFTVTEAGPHGLALRRSAPGGEAVLTVISLAGSLALPADHPGIAPPAGRRWTVCLATEEARFGGDGRWGAQTPKGGLTLTGPGAVVLRAEADYTGGKRKP